MTRTSRIDDSWVLALNTLFKQRLQFGRDIIFTYGPWGFLDARAYHPDTYLWTLLAWGIFAIAFWRVCWMIARRYIPSPVVAFLWMLFTLAVAASSLYVTCCTLLALMGLLAVYHFYLESRPFSLTSLLLVFAVALASLMKFSYLVAAILVLIPIAVDCMMQKRIPWMPFLFLIFFLGLYLAAGQHLSYLWAYLHGSSQIAEGYNDAMSITTWLPIYLPVKTPPVDFMMFAVAAAALIGILAFAQRARPKLESILFLTATGAVVFMVFKWGFVRHDDTHAPLATLGLLSLVLFCAPPLWHRLATYRGRAMIAVVAAMPVMIFGVSAKYVNHDLPSLMGMLRNVGPNLVAATRLVRGSSGLHRQFEDSLAEIRARSPLPPIHGTVDAYPSNLAVPLAYGLDYHPRPIMQSYSAYTPELAQLNADYLQGPRAPGTVLFSVVIEKFWLRHLPSADDGLSWPTLLTRYDIAGASGEFLILHKSNQPRPCDLLPISKTRASFGVPLAVPSLGQGPVWVKIAIDPSLSGKLLSLFYKSPELEMALTTRDGKQQTFRLVAGEARAGFLLSPVVVTNTDFAALASPEWQNRLAGQEVQLVTFSPSGWIGKKWAFRPNIAIEFFQLRFLHQHAE
jgi:hypothetical protein